MTMSSVPPPSHTFNLMFCVYIYNRGFIPQNHAPDDIKIDGCTPQFTHYLFSTVPGQHPIRVVLWPITRKFQNAL